MSAGLDRLCALASRDLSTEAEARRGRGVPQSVLDDVVRVCDARLRQTPNDALLWARRAWAMNAQRRPLAALRDAAEALRCCDDASLEPRVRINVAFALLQSGRFAAAADEYALARSKGADGNLCAKMIERCHVACAGAALADAKRGAENATAGALLEGADAWKKFRPPILDTSDISEEETVDANDAAAALPAVLPAAPPATLPAALPAAAARLTPGRPLRVTVLTDGLVPDRLARSPTKVQDSPTGIHDLRPYNPYSQLFDASPQPQKKRFFHEGETDAADASPAKQPRRAADARA